MIDKTEDTRHESGSPAQLEDLTVVILTEVARRADYTSLSDTELCRAIFQVRSAREPAWRELVGRHEPKVSRAAAAILVRLQGRPHKYDVEDLVEAAWVRLTKGNHRLLRAWNPNRGSLGTFLAQIVFWEARTAHRLWARRKEVKLDESELRRMADKPDITLSPDEVAQLKEAEVKVRAWEANLSLMERSVWEMRKEGASTRAIGQFLGRDHKTVCTILLSIQKGMRQILKDTKP